MGKSHADKVSTGVCEKIYNTVAGTPAYRSNHCKSGTAQNSKVTNGADSNQLSLHQNPGNAGITRVSVPPKVTIAQQKAGPAPVSVDIKQAEIRANPLVSSQKSGGVTISPSPSAKKGDAAKSTTVFVYIQGGEDEGTPKQQKKVDSDNGSKPVFSSLQEGKIKQEKAASPNINVIQGHGQGTNVSPGAEPTKTVHHIPIQGVQANPKSAVPKTMDHIIHPDKSDNRESKDAASDRFSDYIARVIDQMTPNK